MFNIIVASEEFLFANILKKKKKTPRGTVRATGVSTIIYVSLTDTVPKIRVIDNANQGSLSCPESRGKTFQGIRTRENMLMLPEGATQLFIT